MNQEEQEHSKPPSHLHPHPTHESPSSWKASVEMCLYAFDILLSQLLTDVDGHEPSQITTIPNFLLPHSQVHCPLFVTWEKKRILPGGVTIPTPTTINTSTNSSRSSPNHNHRSSSQHVHYDLRGCIGTLSPKPLSTSLGQYAHMAAFQDQRFEPISLEEVPHLRVAVSLLVQYEPCQHVYDWTIGIHGVLIHFTIPTTGREFHATYLPEVSKQQGWTKEETVLSLIRKAGFTGRVHDAFMASIQCTRYQSSKEYIHYQDYVMRKNYDPLKKDSSWNIF